MGLGFILLGALGADWSNRILARLACEHGCMNLSTLAKKAGGEALSKTMAYMVILYVLGGCISYQIIICSLFKYIIKQFGVSEETAESFEVVLGFTVISSVCFLFPLAMKRDMSAFRYVSLASIGALLYTGLVLLIELPEYYSHFRPLQVDNTLPLFRIDFNIFSGAAMTFFAYTCQIQLLPIYSEL